MYAKILLLQWEEMGMQSTQSCVGPWMQCSIPAPKDEDNNAQDCQLEFVVNGPQDGLDKPRGRDSYVLNGPGGYKLSSGVIRPFSQACDAPYMLVRIPPQHLHKAALSQQLMILTVAPVPRTI